MSDTYRAMCAELLDELELWPSWHEATGLIDRARALLAQPEPEGLTDQELLRCGRIATPCYDLKVWERELNMMRAAIAADRARWGHPTPQPVAVSERLPEPEDCDKHGRCWWFTPKEGNTEPFRCADWSFYAGWRQKYTHWLPANALPTPEANV